MAQIPLGNFGNAAPQEGPLVQAPVSAYDTSSGVAALGQGLSEAGNVLQKIQEQRQNAKTALALAQTTNALHDAHDAVSRGVQDGSIPAESAGATLTDQFNKIKGDALQGLGPMQRDALQPALETTSGALGRSLVGTVVKRQQSDTAATIDQFGEQVQRQVGQLGPDWAAQKYGAMVDFTGSAAGWSPEMQAAKKQAFKENTAFGFFDNAGVTALERHDVAGVASVIEKINGPDGDAMDPTKRAVLSHRLFGYQQQMLAQDARQKNLDDQQHVRDYNAASDAYDSAVDLSLGGKVLDRDFVNSLITKAAVAGDGMPERVQTLLARAPITAGFATKTQAERDQIVDVMRQQAADPTKGVDPAANKFVDEVVKMNAKISQEIKDNPWAAAQTRGVITNAPLVPITDPTTALQVLQQRMGQIGTVENWVGKKVSPLQPQEIDGLAKSLKALPPDQAAQLLGSIGDTVKDSDRTAAIAKQLDDKDGTLGLAMAYTNTQTSQGRYIAELILRGKQAIRDKLVQPDRAVETGWRASIAQQIRGAYTNQDVEDKAVDAAFLIMAARSADGTQKNQTIDNAVTLATGGILKDYNGGKIPLPWTMKEGDFTAAVGRVTPDRLAGQAPDGKVMAGRMGMSLDQFVKTLPQAQLVHAGQGLYNVRAGSTLVTNSRGQRITIPISPFQMGPQ